MDLPEGPPGAEGYEDSVVEVPTKKPELDECTKAEQEFQEHLNSLKIKVEDETYRQMVERRGRDVSGKWVYLCYPCHAMCSGESILQTHISGKKHKHKIASRTIWPLSIFEEHPYVLNEKGLGKEKVTVEETEKTLQKMAEEVKLYNSKASEYDQEFNKFREVTAYIERSLANTRTPLVGVEYLIEHPGEESHHEPSYTCTLCSKMGHPRTIINHLTCFWHRYNYICRHYQKACALLSPYRVQNQYREGAGLIINRLIQRIEDKFGRQRPLVIEKPFYEKRKDQIHTWISKSYHFSETNGPSFIEVIDVDLIQSLHKADVKTRELLNAGSPIAIDDKVKSSFNNFSRHPGRQERRAPSIGSLSDISNEDGSGRPNKKRSPHTHRSSRYEPYRREGRERDPRGNSPYRSRYVIRNNNSANASASSTDPDKQKAPNYDHKVKLATEKRLAAAEAAHKMLAYHEKNPEKHPLYPEEWKKFWNKRYKEIVAEGKDPSKHDFKPEWIVYWTKRMKELHDLELKSIVYEIYRKFNLTPPPAFGDKPKLDSVPETRRKTPERGTDRRPPDRGPERRRTPELIRRGTEPLRRGPEPRRRSPDPRRYSPATLKRREMEARRRSPAPRRRSPSPRRRSPSPRRRSPSPRRRSPSPRRLSPPERRRSSSPRRRPSPRRHSPPPRHLRTRSRSPVHINRREPSHSRAPLTFDTLRRSESPLSRRAHAARNKSPARPAPLPEAQVISDDELKPDNGASPWNSDNDISSLPSLPDARSPPPYSNRSRSRPISEHSRSTYAHSQHHRNYPMKTEREGPDDVVSVLRLLVALEDYLGSLGPKIVDLLTDALKMEKEKANSSEDLLERENSVILMETAKERLKGALQAGLVSSSAATPVRSAIVKVAGLLHLADKRAKEKPNVISARARVGVAGVGEVERAQIAQQMAAALIAQGKTDVTAEELAQLVDAVVGMAEAKKREAAKAAEPKRTIGNTASALQLLQSAYKENDKKAEKEDPPDAMDGLSDSDLETLLKNFNELSAEEQHSLVAYLKKMESKEPKRVERLREYVSAAVTSSAATPPTSKSAPPASEPAPVEPAKAVQVIDSDDDDYTVEEVVQSAKQKVKEDQIRHEMEIVKKSLEEKAPAVVVVADASPAKQVNIDKVDINISSASNLLAMVQASIAKASSNTQPVNAAPEVLQPVSQHSYEDTKQQLSPTQSNDLQGDMSNQMAFNQNMDDQMSYNQNMDDQISYNQNMDDQISYNQNMDDQMSYNQNMDDQMSYNQNMDNQMSYNQNMDEQMSFNQNMGQLPSLMRPIQLNMPQQNSGMYQEMEQNPNEGNRLMPNNYNNNQSDNQWDQAMDLDNSDRGGNYDNYDNNYDYNEQVDNSSGMQDMYGANQNYGGNGNPNQSYGVNTNQNPNFVSNMNPNPNFGNANQNSNFGGNNMKPQSFGGNNAGNFNRNNQNNRARGGGGRGGRGGPSGRGGGDGGRAGPGGGRGGPSGRGGGDGGRGGQSGRGGGDGGRGGRGGGDGGRGGRGGEGGRGQGARGRGGRGGGGAPNRGGARGNFSGGRGNRGRW